MEDRWSTSSSQLLLLNIQSTESNQTWNFLLWKLDPKHAILGNGPKEQAEDRKQSINLAEMFGSLTYMS